MNGDSGRIVAWPLATALIGAVFTGLLAWQWRRADAGNQAAWMVGTSVYTIAAAMEAWSSIAGVGSTVYRVYIVLAASLVGFLGLGTLYLTTRNRLWDTPISRS